jgi:hypothetical protein
VQYGFINGHTAGTAIPLYRRVLDFSLRPDRDRPLPCYSMAGMWQRELSGSGPIGDGQPVLGQCCDVRPPGSLSLLRRKRLCCLFAHVT